MAHKPFGMQVAQVLDNKPLFGTTEQEWRGWPRGAWPGHECPAQLKGDQQPGSRLSPDSGKRPTGARTSGIKGKRGK